jgi:UDP-galactopyranose mutase
VRYDVLVCGAGFTGAVIAERLAAGLNKRVLVVDKRDHIGGNAFDHYDEHNVLIHRYGPHIFHTNSERVSQYLSRFTSWTPYEHRVRGWVDGQFIPLPVNMTSLELMFGGVEGQRITKLLTDEFGASVKVPILSMRQSPSHDVRKVADIIYEKVFLHYTLKQWGLRPDELDAAVSARVPVHLSRDDRYFQDQFQCMPADGYARLFHNILSHPLIEVRLKTPFLSAIEMDSFDSVVFTGPIDEYFGRRHGPLPYRSLRFELETRPGSALLQGVGTENYPTQASEHPYTRSTEFRHLTGQSNVSATTRAFEYPEAYVPDRNDPYYPIPREENRALFKRYEADAGALKSVLFAGRLGDYQYYNMDQAIGRALACFEKELASAMRA